ncbi:Anoctamin [Sesbania bispinosa]|nr:Anoctamin [Sesbania bispinosa]
MAHMLQLNCIWIETDSKGAESRAGKDESSDCAYVLVEEFKKVGFVVERVVGIADEFIKLKLSFICVVGCTFGALGRAAAELQIKKRTHIGMDLQFEVEEVDAFVKQPDGSIFSWCERFQSATVNNSKSAITLKFDGKEFHWEVGENLIQKLETENIVKQVFPLHDERKRKKLLRNWALHWWDFTHQPIDEIYSYYGAKVTEISSTSYFLHHGDTLGYNVLSILETWPISSTVVADPAYKIPGRKSSSLQPPMELIKVFEIDNAKGKEVFQRYEWFGRLMRFRNDAMIIFSIICLQLPFELAYAHLYEVVGSDVIKFGLTAIYLFAIQYITKIGGKVSVRLIKLENNENTEKRADSLVYKVFENLLENSLPYLKYSYKKYRVRHKKKNEKGGSREKIQFTSRVEKEYLKPSYSASIGEELEDGLFDDALKLLAILRRPVPRAAATVGAWLNIFKFLILMSICTNCALLAWLYDEEGKWKIEPGLAAILIMEHVLLLIKFGVSRLVPEEPAWVKAHRAKHTTQAQDMCSKKLLRTISGGEKTFGEEKIFGEVKKLE